MSAAADTARRVHRATEALHAFVYFDRGAAKRYAELGLTDPYQQYFASRSAPMGAVGPGVVAAAFYNFSPAVVHAAIPAAWAVASPDLVVAARLDAVADTYAGIFGDTDVGEAVEILAAVTGVVTPLTAGRPLAAAYADLPEPAGDPLRRLWHHLAILREWRGDGHVAALTESGRDPVEALHVHVAAGEGNAQMLQLTRGWPDDRWAAARDALVGRGELTADGELTDTGRQRKQALERRTDELSAAPWEVLGVDRGERLAELLAPHAKAMLSGPLAAMTRR